jgi:S1-C subfamily serine protease
MKTKKTALISFMVLLFVAATPSAELKAAETRPYMGVWLDTSPLPDLLIKHLGLSPSQGIRITNVHRDSPADRAGLERDDIIIAF